MRTFPAIDVAGSRRALAALLDRRVPADAVAVRRDGLDVLAWRVVPAGETEAETRVLFRRDGAEACYAHLGPLDADPEELADFLLADRVVLRRLSEEGEAGTLRLALGSREMEGPGDPSPARQAILAGMAAVADAPTLMLMEETGLHAPGAQEFLDSAGPDAAALHALARAHPWALAVPYLFAEVAGEVRRLASEGTLDAAAAAALGAAEVPVRTAARLVPRLRWMAPTAFPGRFVAHGDICAALDGVPDALWPDPLPGPAPPGGPGQAPLQALYAGARLPAALAMASGRPFADVAGRVEGWDAWLVGLSRRAGVAYDTTHGPPTAERRARDVDWLTSDMVERFAEEVLAPALLARDGRLDYPGPDGTGSLWAAKDVPVLAAAMRLLLGEGTVGAFAETCARWHARSHAIATFTTSLAAGHVHDGPRLFEDLDLGEGRYVACLATAGALLEEGAPGPDAEGALGLDHCVGSYGLAVAAGETAIVSLRRRLPGGGYERLSTAEVRFLPDYESQAVPHIVQHFGRGNAEPAPGLDALLRKAVETVAEEAAFRLAAHRGAHPEQVRLAALVHRAGAWERMRDLWAFALTRPRRSMGQREILAEAGL